MENWRYVVVTLRFSLLSPLSVLRFRFRFRKDKGSSWFNDRLEALNWTSWPFQSWTQSPVFPEPKWCSISGWHHVGLCWRTSHPDLWPSAHAQYGNLLNCKIIIQIVPTADGFPSDPGGVWASFLGQRHSALLKAKRRLVSLSRSCEQFSQTDVSLSDCFVSKVLKRLKK